MKVRRNRYREESPVGSLLLRDRLGLGKFRKSRKRDEEKKNLLLDLWMRTMSEREKDDYIPLGPRRRRLRS
jgi:hypothetical protein